MNTVYGNLGRERDSSVMAEEGFSESLVFQSSVRKYLAGAVVAVVRGPTAQFDAQ